MKKKFSKILGVGLAVVLVLSFSAVPVMANGPTIASFVGDPDYCLTPLEVDFTTTASGTGTLTYDYYWNYQYKQWYGDSYASYTAFPELFAGEEKSLDAGSTPTHTFTVPGFYNVKVVVTDEVGSIIAYEEIRTLGIIPSPIAYDVKGSTQQFEVKGAADGAGIDWWLESGVALDPADVTLSVDGNGFIATVKSMRKGDIHIYAEVNGDPCGEGETVLLHAEKKWGELAYTELDVDPDTVGVQNTKAVVTFAPDATGTYEEVITDMAYATFFEVIGTRAVGGAIVHWWLFEDTDANQALIDELMDHLAAQGGALDDNYWAAHGKYNTDVLAALYNDWSGIGIPDVATAQPFQVINAYALGPDLIAGTADDRFADPTIFSWEESGTGYHQNVTEDSFPAEVRGRAQATLEVDVGELVECVPEEVMIVVLVTYPGSGNPEQDPFNGENIIVVEKGKKEFHKKIPVPPAQVKSPQVAWAGEKIVLEKDWGELGFDGYGYPRVVSFQLEHPGLGTLEPYPLGFTLGEIVYTLVDEEGVARVILNSEEPGQADVKSVLYYTIWIDIFDFLEEQAAAAAEVAPEEIIFPIPMQVIGNHAFPVFFLKLEEITTIVPEPVVEPDEDALFGVQVKGWFTSSNISTRPAREVDHDGDGVMDEVLPAGRWVLPDDWATLAGIPETRTHWDIMNNWEDGIISSTDPLGPYNTAVVTTAAPGLAESPVIGPFNTTQPVAIEDEVVKWVATASVMADYTVAPVVTVWTVADLRTTVVPDGKIDWFDAPMPRAKVIFQASDDLAAAFKSLIEPYSDVVNDIYYAPFYSSEIPAHWAIPVLGIPEGYNWDSWGLWTPGVADDGAYPFWGDLGLSASTKKLEVYTDNNGIAYVTVVGLEEPGSVDISAIVDYPYLRKHPAMRSAEETITWGPVLVELNANFIGEPRSGDSPLTVTFTDTTTLGVPPYVLFVWDFGDGITETTTVGTVTHIYTTPGVYTVSLTVTDSDPLGPFTNTETKSDYITVEGEVPVDILAYYRAYSGDPGVVETTDLLKAANDWANGIVPTNFTESLSTAQLLELANEWAATG